MEEGGKGTPKGMLMEEKFNEVRDEDGGEKRVVKDCLWKL